MENISKLEERLELSRKQRKILKHELGAGKSCLACKEKCVGGLNLHFWRKICINCKCPKERHDLLPEDFDEDSFQILGVKVPEHKKLYKYIRQTPAAAAVQADNHVEWVPLVAEKDDGKINEKINKYFDELGGENHVPFARSEAAAKRKELAALQIPPHDFNAQLCHNLSDIETANLEKYVEDVKKNNFGQGTVDVVIENVFSMPTGSKNFDLNAINNNDLNERMNQLTLDDNLTCRGCKQHITSAYVKAERLGTDAVWHPKCFKCKKCSQLLVDLIYFHLNNEIYCARDLASEMKIPRCFSCDELILVAEFTLADGKNYHIKHFCCDFCDVPLAGLQYVSDDQTNTPVCLNCYDLHQANKCSICKKIISPNEEGVSLKNLHYHMTCFSCSACKKELIGSRFCIKQDIPFCSAACVNAVLNNH